MFWENSIKPITHTKKHFLGLEFHQSLIKLLLLTKTEAKTIKQGCRRECQLDSCSAVTSGGTCAPAFRPLSCDGAVLITGTVALLSTCFGFSKKW